MERHLIPSNGFHMPRQDSGDHHLVPTYGYQVDDEGGRIETQDDTPRFDVKSTMLVEGV